MLSVPRHLPADSNIFVIAIKPERFPEPVVERRQVGGMSLTLSVRHGGYRAFGFILSVELSVEQLLSYPLLLQCCMSCPHDAIVQSCA
jgi:hypothetical protein